MKFDGAADRPRQPGHARLAELAGFGPDDVVFLAGSTQEPEEQLALDAFASCADWFPRLRLILVPRHPERFDARGADARRQRHRLAPAQPVGRPAAIAARPRGRGMLLVDRIGELRAVVGHGPIAFVGGSLTARGGQNMIEPAAYGRPSRLAPATHNFRDVVALLLAAGAAVVVRDGDDLTAFVTRCLERPEFAAQLGAVRPANRRRSAWGHGADTRFAD